MNAPHRMASFDRGQQRRRSMIAKINIARQQLRMAEDDYRQLLLDSTGHISLKDCSDAQLAQMIDALKSKGFAPLPRAGGKPAAQHPMARKARALWISLYHLGVVHNPSEEALEAFAKRQLGCDRLAWARQSDAYRLIEALKAMGSRHGWRQSNLVTQKPLTPLGLQESLCVAILDRLVSNGGAPDSWTLNTAAWRLCGIELGRSGPMTAEQYTELAAALGRKLRETIPDIEQRGAGQ